jgi:hypothetical protein
VKVDLSQNASGFRRLEGFIERSRLVRIEIIQGQFNGLCLGITFIHQPLHLAREIELCAALCNLDVSPSGLRLDKQKDVVRAVALILIIVALGLTGSAWQQRASLFDQLLILLANSVSDA